MLTNTLIFICSFKIRHLWCCIVEKTNSHFAFIREEGYAKLMLVHCHRSKQISHHSNIDDKVEECMIWMIKFGFIYD